MARPAAHVTLSATTLLHQAYLDIAERDGTSFPDRARFMGYAARVMRGIIINYARNCQAQKPGGRFEITILAGAQSAVDDRQLVKVSEALDELAKAEPFLAEIVDLKFFVASRSQKSPAKGNL